MAREDLDDVEYKKTLSVRGCRMRALSEYHCQKIFWV